MRAMTLSLILMTMLRRVKIRPLKIPGTTVAVVMLSFRHVLLLRMPP